MCLDMTRQFCTKFPCYQLILSYKDLLRHDWVLQVVLIFISSSLKNKVLYFIQVLNINMRYRDEIPTFYGKEVVFRVHTH